MEVTKHNVLSIVENYLKENKIRFEIVDSDSEICLYQLFVSSLIGGIQIEYSLDDPEDNYVVAQLYIVDNDDLYDGQWNNENNDSESLEDEIFGLLERVRELNKVISKVERKIEDIKEICKEVELDHEIFIRVQYDFDKD
jgi:hypothetical protein